MLILKRIFIAGPIQNRAYPQALNPLYTVLKQSSK